MNKEVLDALLAVETKLREIGLLVRLLNAPIEVEKMLLEGFKGAEQELVLFAALLPTSPLPAGAKVVIENYLQLSREAMENAVVGLEELYGMGSKPWG